MGEVVACNQALDRNLLERFRDQSNRPLAELTDERPQLIVFLRHSGCTFCRQAVADVVRQSPEIQHHGTGIVFVHMMAETEAGPFFRSLGAGDITRISDPEQELYESFGLANGSLWQLVGPAAWWRGAKAFLAERHSVGWPVGNLARLPGTFVVYRGRILYACRGETSSDRPNYAALAACPLPTSGE